MTTIFLLLPTCTQRSDQGRCKCKLVEMVTNPSSPRFDIPDRNQTRTEEEKLVQSTNM